MCSSSLLIFLFSKAGRRSYSLTGSAHPAQESVRPLAKEKGFRVRIPFAFGSDMCSSTVYLAHVSRLFQRSICRMSTDCPCPPSEKQRKLDPPDLHQTGQRSSPL